MTATPFLEIDLELVTANVHRMAHWAAASGVTLRPHVKTHKSIALAQRQLDAGASGITVATVGEAEVFAHAGFRDIFVAYPLWIDADLGRRLNSLTEHCVLTLGVDSVAGATQALQHTVPDVRWMIEVDSGHHRTGVPPHAVRDIARVLLDGNAAIEGAFSFPGHSYSPDGRARAAAAEAEALSGAHAALSHLGVPTIRLSGGSTPSMEFADTSVVTEFRPGVYLFGDAQQWELGSHSPADIALWARATVVSVGDGRFVTNAGSKLLGADRAGYATGYGRLLDDPDARIVLLSEHHSVIESATVPALGSQLRIVPNHVCNAVNLVDQLHTTDGALVTVDARGMNS